MKVSKGVIFEVKPFEKKMKKGSLELVIPDNETTKAHTYYNNHIFKCVYSSFPAYSIGLYYLLDAPIVNKELTHFAYSYSSTLYLTLGAEYFNSNFPPPILAEAILKANKTIKYKFIKPYLHIEESTTFPQNQKKQVYQTSKIIIPDSATTLINKDFAQIKISNESKAKLINASDIRRVSAAATLNQPNSITLEYTTEEDLIAEIK